jgi:acetyl esterase/lipase
MRTARISVVCVALVALGTVLPARAGTRYRDPVFEQVIETEDLVYGHATTSEGEELDLILDLFVPEGDDTTGRPAIVLAPGGGFTNETKDEPIVVELATRFARRGYVTATIDYRVRPEIAYQDLIVGSLAGQLPDAMHDAQHDMQAAVRWMRANAAAFGVDADTIVAGGFSAGASMALEAAYNPDDPGDSNDLDVPSDVAAAVSLSGATDPRRIETGRPPVAMFNGVQDTTAPYLTAVLACGVATILGNVCELSTFPGSGHDLRPMLDQIEPAAACFLYRHVIGAATC